MLATIARPLSNLQVVVLAAGFSTRLGQPKSLARIHGASLLRRTIHTVARISRDPVLVVVPMRATRLRAELRGYTVRFLGNALRARGLSASVLLALQQTRRHAGTLFLPADLVHLTRRDIEYLVSCWRVQRRKVTARVQAGRASTPLILPRHLYRDALRIQGDVGLRDFVAELPARDRLLVALPSAQFDVDTPQDLAAARLRFARLVAIPAR